EELQRRGGGRLQACLTDRAAETQLVEQHQLREPGLVGDDVRHVRAGIDRGADLPTEGGVLVLTRAHREEEAVVVAQLLGGEGAVCLVLRRRLGGEPLLSRVRRRRAQREAVTLAEELV